MFGKKKAAPEEVAVEQEVAPLPKGYTPPKGTATPKRKVAEAANRHPIVADRRKLTKEERKARKAANRKASDDLYYKQQQAMRTGDERNMPYQHQGKVRRFGRDVVDSYSPISGWFMPLAVLLIPMMFFTARYPRFSFWATIAFYVIFILMALHALFIARRARMLAAYKYGDAQVPRGFIWQMLGRGFYPRRWRLPSPQVKRGEYPEGGAPSDLKEARLAAREERKLQKENLKKHS